MQVRYDKVAKKPYYDITLNDRNKEYILSAIREMLDKIARLKDLMENPDNKHRNMVHPSEYMQMQCAWINRLPMHYRRMRSLAEPIIYEMKWVMIDEETQIFNILR